MRVTIAGNTYDIRWEYVPVMSATGKHLVIRTACQASLVISNEVGSQKYQHAVGPVFVTQNPRDKHEKKRARKIALAKLLRGWLTKSYRKDVWDQYFASAMGKNDHG